MQANPEWNTGDHLTALADQLRRLLELDPNTAVEPQNCTEALEEIQRNKVAMAPKLVISCLGLKGLPWELFSMHHLEALNCNFNYIETVPSEISHLTNLKVLRMESNLLAYLPVELSRLHNLSKLWISDNRIQSLPREIFHGLRNLRELSISNNPITSLPDDIGCLLPNLEYLSCYSCSLTSLPTSIVYMRHLSVLYIRRNPLKALPFEFYLRSQQPEPLWSTDISTISNPWEELPRLNGLRKWTKVLPHSQPADTVPSLLQICADYIIRNNNTYSRVVEAKVPSELVVYLQDGRVRCPLCEKDYLDELTCAMYYWRSEFDKWIERVPLVIRVCPQCAVDETLVDPNSMDW